MILYTLPEQFIISKENGLGLCPGKVSLRDDITLQKRIRMKPEGLNKRVGDCLY